MVAFTYFSVANKIVLKAKIMLTKNQHCCNISSNTDFLLRSADKYFSDFATECLLQGFKFARRREWTLDSLDNVIIWIWVVLLLRKSEMVQGFCPNKVPFSQFTIYACVVT